MACNEILLLLIVVWGRESARRHYVMGQSMTFGPQKKNDDQKTEFDCFFLHTQIHIHPPARKERHTQRNKHFFK